MQNRQSIQDAKTKQVVSQLEKPIRHLTSGEFKLYGFKPLEFDGFRIQIR